MAEHSMLISNLETHSDEDYKRVSFSEQDLDISCYSLIVKLVEIWTPEISRECWFCSDQSQQWTGDSSKQKKAQVIFLHLPN